MASSTKVLAVEALLVAADRPIPLQDLRSALPELDVDAVIRELDGFWSGRGMRIVVERDAIRMLPAPSVAARLAEIEGRGARRLSEAAVATLAVIAMHQPITLAEIERIRGVRLSRGLMESLLDANVVRVALRRTDAGRAAAYVTTDGFLRGMSLGSIDDLPLPDEIDGLVDPPLDA